MTAGNIHSFETFGSVDGPGVRFIVFLQGCRMRCRYCHNPDTWQLETADMLRMEPAAVLARALRYRTYWNGGGGITASGGEPLLQIDFLTELFELAKKEGVHTTLDTAAEPFTREQSWFGKFERLMAATDLVMLDIKDIREDGHRHLTGRTGQNILDCARYLSDSGKPMWIRHVLVPGWTDDDAALGKLRAFIDTLRTVERVEVLPFHNMAAFKWEKLGIKYVLKDAVPPEPERVANARRILRATGA